ncbi:MAG: MBL fold metallo-hydrolase [Pirellulales bacterium]|jgi:phosphoribosyl 1,2-cyclic phosphodiesterase|nr:MBL fold metallo-hydrolase [Pirellulales bacterium]
MIVISLQSGSNGNCLYVESRGIRLLVDAGISARQAEDRLLARGREICGIDALLISHDHTDHTRSMGTFQRKFSLPVYITEKTLSAVRHRTRLGKVSDIQSFIAGDSIQLAHVTVETLPTPHDGVDGVGFVIDDGERRLGVLTDLGHVFDGLSDVLKTLDAIVIESNYDPAMLERGGYPEHLKQRIRGPGGHLSNRESAELLSSLSAGSLQWACLAHLSEKNNAPELAIQTHRKLCGNELMLYVASRYQASECIEV